MRILTFGLCFLMAGLVAEANAAKNGSKLTRQPRKGSTAVELFEAVKNKQVEVKLIPKNAEQATVIVSNKTKKPLSIQMPSAFAGMPVLAQGGNNNNGGGGGGGGGGNQGMGGGMGGGMMGGGGMGMGGGFFNVAPEKVGKIKVTTVCLEHGKEDPNPRIPYEMRPITDFTQKKELIALCQMLGNGKLDQVTAQAAAWHLSDGLSWKDLAKKVKVRHLNGQVKMYFSPDQIRNAAGAARMAISYAAKQKDAELSPGELQDQAAKLETVSVAR